MYLDTSDTDHATTDSDDSVVSRLQSAIAVLTGFQERHALSNKAMTQRFAIGTDSTYGKLIKEQYETLSLDRWLPEYEAAAEAILHGRSQQREDLYDLPHIIALKKLTRKVTKRTDSARVIFVEGETGSGKSSAKKILQQDYASRCLLVEASEPMNDRPNAFLGLILSALGESAAPIGQWERYRRVIALLGKARRMLLIDEAHHLGPHCLNTLKALINETPGEIVLFSIPTLWRRLEHAAYEECRQLRGPNRCAGRIVLTTANPDTIGQLIQARTGVAAADITALCDSLAEQARLSGGLALIREVIRTAENDAEDAALRTQKKGSPLTRPSLTAEDITQAAKKVCRQK